jgi:hypothetical protein
MVFGIFGELAVFLLALLFCQALMNTKNDALCTGITTCGDRTSQTQNDLETTLRMHQLSINK